MEFDPKDDYSQSMNGKHKSFRRLEMCAKGIECIITSSLEMWELFKKYLPIKQSEVIYDMRVNALKKSFEIH